MSEENVKIGLETHLQLLTDSKLFCGCPTTGNDNPNTRVCPTCLGMPGSRPRINKRAIEMGIKVAAALGCETPDEMNFSRKTYFYPDMPKNFQITQFSIPVGTNGEVTMELDSQEKTVRIKRVHIEEDPGKLKHIGGNITSSDYVLIDYNRSGVPLCEIVTKPDLKSPEEARTFLRKLSEIFEYLGVYDTTGEATIRSDANISTGGERAEVKNITGFKDTEKALRYEIRRQVNLKKRGRKVKRETRGYDDKSGTTKPLRTKEQEADYGYIFEPDLTRIELRDSWVNTLEKEIPELPHQKKRRYVDEYQLSKEVAAAICSDFDMTKIFEDIINKGKNVSIVANILSGPVKKVLNYNEIRLAESEIDEQKIIKIVDMVENKEITDRNAEMIIRDIAIEDKDPEDVKKEKGLGAVTDDKIDDMVDEVLRENEDVVEDYMNGKGEALNHLVGKIMEKSRGNADPRNARDTLKKRIEN